MTLQECYSIAHTPFFDGNYFAYWKGKMEYYLMMDIKMWIIVKDAFEKPKDALREPLEFINWSNGMK